MAEGGGEGQATGANTRTSDVFISYASDNSAVAKSVCEALERAGINCWIAPRDVTPGEFYAGSIVHAIDAAKATVLILSQNSAASPHVVREVERAASKRHPVISLRIDKAPLPAELEYFLNTSQWLDASDGEPARVMPKLVAAVRFAIDKPSTPEPAIAGTPSRASKAASDGWSRRRKAIVAGSVVIAAFAGFAAYRLWLPGHRVIAPAAAVTTGTPAAVTTATAIPEKSVAVLPFVDMSEKKDQEYFSDGLSEELIDHLSHSPDLKVIARTSSFQFKGRNEDVRTIGQRLGVAHLLEGSVRKSGKTLRITVQLIRVSDGFHVWSETYQRSLDDIFKVQDEIATSITRTLQSTLTANASLARETTNVDAYNLLLKGNFLRQRATTGDQYRALSLYQEAIRLDPNYARAWVKVGSIYHGLGYSGQMTVTDAEPKARSAVERALLINPKLAYAHEVLGNIYRDFDWDWKAAKSAFEKAIELDSSMTSARANLGYLTWIQTGNIDDEIEVLRQDLARDPLATDSFWTLGVSYWAARRFQESIDTFGRLLELNPNYEGGQSLYGQSLLFTGQYDKALAAVEKESDEQSKLGVLPCVYWKLGRRAESDAVLETLKKKYGEKTGAYTAAQMHACRGENKAALEWLELAYRHRESGMGNIKFDPYFIDLHNETGFHALLVKLKLDD
ncbi:MAG: TIR domain-containing protein [Steroidobacteraceae bacterium]